jgi:hypothetical protein
MQQQASAPSSARNMSARAPSGELSSSWAPNGAAGELLWSASVSVKLPSSHMLKCGNACMGTGDMQDLVGISSGNGSLSLQRVLNKFNKPRWARATTDGAPAAGSSPPCSSLEAAHSAGSSLATNEGMPLYPCSCMLFSRTEQACSGQCRNVHAAGEAWAGRSPQLGFSLQKTLGKIGRTFRKGPGSKEGVGQPPSPSDPAANSFTEGGQRSSGGSDERPAVPQRRSSIGAPGEGAQQQQRQQQQELPTRRSSLGSPGSGRWQPRPVAEPSEAWQVYPPVRPQQARALGPAPLLSPKAPLCDWACCQQSV